MMSIHNLKSSRNTLKISKVLRVLENDSFLHQARANRTTSLKAGAGLKGSGRERGR